MDIFLIILALVWLAFASISDIRKREVPNWLSFSLIAFALAYRVFYSILYFDIMFLVYGVLGLGIFIGLGYAFYYGRVFAGGDAKLLMGIGAILPVSSSLLSNIIPLFGFVFLFLLAGSLWGIFYSLIIVFRNSRKFGREFLKQTRENRKIFYIAFAAAVLSLGLLFLDSIFIMLTGVFILFPVLYIYAKAVEESCMIKEIKTSDLTEGDWLYETVRVGNRKIEPNWEGLSLQEIKLLVKYKRKVLVKEGIPFVPAFFFAFIILILFQNYLLGMLSF
jgi:Flp pilus assembly protein protease CpaA